MLYLLNHISEGFNFISIFLGVYLYSLILIFSSLLIFGLFAGFIYSIINKR